jgi:ribosome-associated protein
MAKKIIIQKTEILIKTINNAILKKKGENLLNLDMTKLDNAVAKHFIICHGSSSTQVRSIASYVEEMVRENLNEKPWKKEGYNNSEWILLDFVNVVVHIFQPNSREFYKLEKLWADAKTILIEN